MKLEVSMLQLAEWLINGIAVIIALLQVDSVNDRTRWPIPRAILIWERIKNAQGAAKDFFHSAESVQIPNGLKPFAKVTLLIQTGWPFICKPSNCGLCVESPNG